MTWVVILVGLTACFDYDYGENKRDCERAGGTMQRGCGDSRSHCSVQTSAGGGGSSTPATSQPDWDCNDSNDCGPRERCVHNTCTFDTATCAGDIDCPIGSACVDRTCRCTLDLACGSELTCTRLGCEVCMAGVCRAPTCDTDGRCPVPLRCDERTLECFFGDRITCGEDASCPLLMQCGPDSRCERVTTPPDAGDAASLDTADAY